MTEKGVCLCLPHPTNMPPPLRLIAVCVSCGDNGMICVLCGKAVSGAVSVVHQGQPAGRPSRRRPVAIYCAIGIFDVFDTRKTTTTKFFTIGYYTAVYNVLGVVQYGVTDRTTKYPQ